MTKASAPGKIILLGEHAVVYGQPALAVPVNQIYAEAEVSDIPRAGIWVNAPDIGLHEELSRIAPENPLASVISAVYAEIETRKVSREIAENDHHRQKKFSLPQRTEEKPFGAGTGIEIKITSTIPLAAGLGSGAAVSVAIIRALSAHIDFPIDDEQINMMAYEVEKIHHGTPSGIDNTVVTYGKPIFFLKIPYWVFPPIGGSKFPTQKGGNLQDGVGR